MARVTVEKCKGMVRDNFELVVLAAVRAKDINSGAPLTLERENDKDPVMALREIEAGYIKIDALKERLVVMLQKGSAIEKQQEEIKVNLEEEEDFSDDFAFDEEGGQFEISDEDFSAEDSFAGEGDFGDNQEEEE
jgi:DNA-directed RNA polymerase subunit omega